MSTDGEAIKPGNMLSHRRSGSHVADLNDLYERYWDELCRYLNRRFGTGPPEPEDIAQSAFARFVAVPDRQRITNPRAFLYKVARNAVVDHHRKTRCQDSYVADALARAGEEILDEITPERVIIERERFAILNDVVKRLPEKQRRVLMMSRYHGETYAEIARKTGWSKSDIGRQVIAAVEAIDEALRAADGNADK